MDVRILHILHNCPDARIKRQAGWRDDDSGVTVEVKQLDDRLHQVEQERDHLQVQVEQLMPLQQECDRLKGQLQIAQDHLTSFD